MHYLQTAVHELVLSDWLYACALHAKRQRMLRQLRNWRT